MAKYNKEKEPSDINSEESVELVATIAENNPKKRSFRTEFKLQVIKMAIKDKNVKKRQNHLVSLNIKNIF